VNKNFRVPEGLIEFIKNNDKKLVEEILSDFSNFWEIDRNKLTELINGEKEIYGKVHIKNFGKQKANY
jgi:succinate dehydrogenase flavin-adding protein (antitoxin of CptAB toxin-antitoxin module)